MCSQSEAFVLHCQFCDFQSDSVTRHVAHSHHHSAILRGRVPCGYAGKCQVILNCETTLRTHLLRSHLIKVKPPGRPFQTPQTPQTGGEFACSVNQCNDTFHNFLSLYRHLEEHVQSGCSLSCPQRNCTKSYIKLTSLKSHVSRKHPELQSVNQNNSLANTESGGISVDTGMLQDSTDFDASASDFMSTGREPMNVDKSRELESTVSLQTQNMALLLLKLETEFYVPASTVQFLVNQLQIMDSNTLDNQIKRVTKSLTENGVDPDHIDKVVAILNESKLVLDESLKTDFLRKKTYQSLLGYVSPVKIMVNKTDQKFFYYVPIAETLQNIVKWYGSLLTFDRNESDSTLLSSYRDGSVYKGNVFLSSGDKLEIILYQDAVNLVNLTGGVRKQHKLECVYMSVGNLPIHMRSKIENIHLVALCTEDNFNSDRVFGRITSDLLKLESTGINVNGKDILGSVVYVAGDNLGQSGVGGTVENFSKALFFCRFCLMSRVQWIEDCLKLRVGFYETRSVESYIECLQVLQATKAKNHKGVRKDSQFNKLEHFHVCAPGLPPCISHDLYLGIVPFDLHLYLMHLINDEGWLSLQELNFRIKHFGFAQTDLNRPAEVSENSAKLAGTAAEIRCLLKLLPLMMSDKVQFENDVWENLLRLSQISDFLCAPHVDPKFLPFLQDLTVLYVEQRLRLFPDVPLRPKHHFVAAHYAELTLAFGPLKHVWTMEFERKHHPHKRATRSSRNFKNVTKSLAMKHQLNQCSRYTEIPKGLISMEGEAEFSFSFYADGIQSAIRKAGVDPVFECSSAKFKGTKYTKNCLVVTNQTAFERAVNFGRVRVIISDGIEQVCLVVEEFRSEFHSNLRAYTLSEPMGFVCVNVATLLHYKPVSEYKVDVKTYLRLSHSMPYYSVM